MRVRVLFSFVLPCLFLAPAAPTQLPPGDIVVSGFSWPVYGVTQPGGLFFVNPGTGVVAPVTGLPVQLTGTPTGVAQGADAVLRLPKSGCLAAIGWGPVNQPVSLFVLNVTGTAATVKNQYVLGTITNVSFLGIPAIALLPDERVLVVVDQRNVGLPGPFGNAWLGIVDPSLPPGSATTVVPVPSIPTGGSNALAVDRVNRIAYVAVITGSTTTLYAVPVPGGGAPRRVATLFAAINCLAVEPNGDILAGGFVSGPVRRLFRVNPITGTAVLFPQLPLQSRGVFHGMWIEPVSGDLILVDGWVTTTRSVLRLSPRTTTGTVSTIPGTGPAGGWPMLSGVDGFGCLQGYGDVSGISPEPRWRLAPNPGGAPVVPNSSFSLTVSTPSFVLLGVAPMCATVPLTPPIQLLVNPVVPVLSNGSGVLSLPIPNDPTLRGGKLFAQAAALTPAAFAMSPGLEITLK